MNDVRTFNPNSPARPMDASSGGQETGATDTDDTGEIVASVLDLPESERLDALTDHLSGLTAEEGALVIAGLVEEDVNLTGWLGSDAVLAASDSGALGAQEANVVVAAIAEAYNSGAIGYHQMAEITGMQVAIDVQGRGLGYDETTDFLRFIALSDAPEVGTFRERVATDIFSGRIPSGLDPSGSRAGDSMEIRMAIYLVSEGSGNTEVLYPIPYGSGNWQLDGVRDRSTALADVLAPLTPEQRQLVYQAASHDNHAFDSTIGEPGPLPDTFGLITASIAASDDSGPVLALEMLRFVEDTPDAVYDGQVPYPTRSEQLSEMFLAHDAFLLDTLTTGSQQPISATDSRHTEFGENLATLGDFMRYSALNGANPQQSQVLDAIREYIGPHVELANTLPASIDTPELQAQVDDSYSRVIGLAAALQDSVHQAHSDLVAELEAQRAFVGLVIEIGLIALPLAGTGKAEVASGVAQLITGGSGPVSGRVNQIVERALNGLSGKIIDTTTGQLSREARDAIIAALGEDEAIVEELFQNSQAFIQDTIIENSPIDRQIGRDIMDVRDQIDASR